jgi:hypothetical protein
MSEAQARVGDLAAAMEAIAPSRYAESWDNVGLLVGDRAAPLVRVLLVYRPHQRRCSTRPSRWAAPR